MTFRDNFEYHQYGTAGFGYNLQTCYGYFIHE